MYLAAGSSTSRRVGLSPTMGAAGPISAAAALVTTGRASRHLGGAARPAGDRACHEQALAILRGAGCLYGSASEQR